jgi:anti-sigma factor ChrR (cupin superfamily)
LNDRPELEELAALDAVGALDADARTAYRERLARATPVERTAVAAMYDAAALLTNALVPIIPPPRLKERILGSVTANAEIYSLRARERQWQETPVPGVDVQPLHLDSAWNVVVLLARLAPGAVYAAHRHSGGEECYVLAGDVTIQGEHLAAGDFHHAASGTDHGAVTSQGGAELLLVMPPPTCHRRERRRLTYFRIRVAQA